MLSTFPPDGAPSKVLTTTYRNPRCLYLTEWMLWTSVAILRWFLWLKDFRIVLTWSCVDTCLMLINAFHLFGVNSCCHHRQRYLKTTPQDVSTSEVTHCLALLHYKEPESQLYGLVGQLAQQYTEGKKVLIIGMEEGTGRRTEKLQKIEETWGSSFDNILYTVHRLRDGEIPGTCSNHFEVQVAADLYFPDKTNVIISKFDCNMRIAGELLREIETQWCALDDERRHSVTFMPNVCWSADIPDADRSLWEIGVALGLCASGNTPPFPMSFVSGSLAGAIEAGYTPPSLLAEDELLYSKKAVLFPHAHTRRLSSTIMKIFYPAEVCSTTFVTDVFLPKVERWYVGWVEVHGYVFSWLFQGLKDHPPVYSCTRTAYVLFISVMRMYIAFVAPLSCIPSTAVGYFGWRNYKADSLCYHLLLAQLIGVIVYILLNLIMALTVLNRVYRSFDCLKFSCMRCTAAVICAFPLYVVLPLHLLWTYFKHGMLNRSVVHTANMECVRKTLPHAFEPEAEPEAPGFKELEIAEHSKRLLSKAENQLEIHSDVSATKRWISSSWKQDGHQRKYLYKILVEGGQDDHALEDELVPM